MRIFRSGVKVSFLLTAILLAGLLIYPLGQKVYSQSRNTYAIIKDKMKVLNQILLYVNELYFEDVDMETLMEGAFDGIMKKLDPHSIYIPAKEMKDIEEQFQGKFQGIGIEFDILHGYVTVISPVADSPAEKAGLLPGDQIVEIDGQDAYNITKEEVFKTLRGPKGTPVTIKVARIGLDKPFQVTIIRDNIPLYSVRAAVMLDDKTGYIWLTRFSATTSDEVREAIRKLDQQGMQQLLFDLRNNSGGYLEQAAEIANLFLAEKDTIVYTKGKRSDVEQVFLADPSKGRSDLPLVVLVNRGSASASEIVAGAIQDLDRGLVVGETTFGKGLVQRQIPLKDGSAIRVTIARYYTPSGRLIQRPYKNGDDHDYYKELYEENREAKMDSLKKLRPKYYTRNHRVVYGGGGITPDEYVPWEPGNEPETRKLLSNPKRPFFNWASLYTSRHQDELSSWEYSRFKAGFQLTEADFQSFLDYLQTEEIQYDSAATWQDRDYILNALKAEIAGDLWGRDEAMGIRMLKDNQVNAALDLFEEAAEFLTSKP
ncbi:MAG: S41 family peptidase [Candidatus Neomarinimicrobiota bacterium]|nr:MAG: S41 family peptidase [Candidatus Neomarinimicrobiota bacterium]